MQLEQLSYVSEVVGAIAIVITIIFLIVEVRRNTNESKRQFMEGATSQRSSLVRMIAADQELAQVIGRGLAGSRLPDDQWFRFNMFLYALFVEFEFNQRRVKVGEMDRDLWEAWIDAYNWWLQYPGVRNWWHRAPAGFTDSFREYIDSHIENQPIADVSQLADPAESGNE